MLNESENVLNQREMDMTSLKELINQLKLQLNKSENEVNIKLIYMEITKFQFQLNFISNLLQWCNPLTLQPEPGGGNFNRRVTGVCHLTSEIAP